MNSKDDWELQVEHTADSNADYGYWFGHICNVQCGHYRMTFKVELANADPRLCVNLRQTAPLCIDYTVLPATVEHIAVQTRATDGRVASGEPFELVLIATDKVNLLFLIR